jgi:hypothetical protein
MSSSSSKQNQQEKQASEAKEDATAEENATAKEDPEAEEDAEAKEDPAGSLTETAECPACGRRFVGDYCPGCGQAADPSVSATGVIGGFFRELVDVENGFWPTFVGLTLRPGKTLQKYLSGVRKGLIGPGRYLLVAVVVVAGTDQVERWIGTEPPPVAGPYMTADGKKEALEVALDYYGLVGEQARILPFLLLTVLLAFGLQALFRDRFSRGAEALAVGSFLTGHAVLLSEGADLAFLGARLSGGPPVELQFRAAVVLVAAYAGIACWGCFGPGWKAALKGAFGGAWAWVELSSIVGVASAGTAVWLASAYPDAYYAFDPGGTQVGEFLALAGVFSAPLLLHAGVEALTTRQK